jgi:hypothetical protein
LAKADWHIFNQVNEPGATETHEVISIHIEHLAIKVISKNVKPRQIYDLEKIPVCR